MEATVNILHGHVLTNTKKERNLQHLTVKLSYRDKSHCLALHCIALLASLRWPHLILWQELVKVKIPIKDSTILFSFPDDDDEKS